MRKQTKFPIENLHFYSKSFFIILYLRFLCLFLTFQSTKEHVNVQQIQEDQKIIKNRIGLTMFL